MFLLSAVLLQLVCINRIACMNDITLRDDKKSIHQISVKWDIYKDFMAPKSTSCCDSVIGGLEPPLLKKLANTQTFFYPYLNNLFPYCNNFLLLISILPSQKKKM